MGTIICTPRWVTPVSRYPESRSGRFCITKNECPAGYSFETGEASGIDEVLFTSPVTFTILKENNSTWMSDTPMEYYQANDLATRTIGNRILVGGLGLGLITFLLSNREDVKEIIVVEKEPEIINLVARFLPSKVKVIEGDFLTELTRFEENSFNTIIADIWKTGFSPEDKELFQDCKMTMEDYHPDSTHLFWAFQKQVDEDNAKIIIHYLNTNGVAIVVHETSEELSYLPKF